MDYEAIDRQYKVLTEHLRALDEQQAKCNEAALATISEPFIRESKKRVDEALEAAEGLIALLPPLNKAEREIGAQHPEQAGALLWERYRVFFTSVSSTHTMLAAIHHQQEFLLQGAEDAVVTQEVRLACSRETMRRYLKWRRLAPLQKTFFRHPLLMAAAGALGPFLLAASAFASRPASWELGVAGLLVSAAVYSLVRSHERLQKLFFDLNREMVQALKADPTPGAGTDGSLWRQLMGGGES
jgi:hypothetical protein